MKNFKSLVVAVMAMFVMITSFAKPLPAAIISTEKMEHAVRKAALNPPPAVASLTGTWVQGSNPFIQFTLTLFTRTTVQEQYYLDVFYYNSFLQTSTTELFPLLIVVNAGQITGTTQSALSISQGFYGVESYSVALVNP
jgi:hypothetical protein